MLTFILIYCTATSPTQCVERHPVTDQFAMPVACFQAAQEVAASEEERMEAEYEHPGYQFSRVRCEPAGRQGA